MLNLFLTNTQLIASEDITWWTGVVWIIVMFYQLFGLSFWRHPFTAEHPLVSEISPDLFPWRNKWIYILDGFKSTLVCMMRDNKEIWFDVIALDQKISNQASHAFKHEGLLSNEIRFMLSVFSTAKVCVFFQQKLKSPITPVLLSTPAKLNGPRPNGAYWLRRHMTFLNEQLGRGHRWIMFGGLSFTHCWYKIPSSVNSVNCFMQNSKLCISLMFLKLRYERFLGVKSEQNGIPEQVHERISVLWYSVVRYNNDILGALERFGSDLPGHFRDIMITSCS